MRVSLTVVVVILAMLLPYLPGRFDASAYTLSFLAQLAAFAGIVLTVPVGIVWILNRNRSQLWHKLTLGLAGIIACVLMIAAVAVNQFALGLIIGVCCALPSLKAGKRGLHERAQKIDRATRLPFYLVSIPILLVAFRSTVLPIAAERSRTRVIRHSTPLIREIELFRERRGHYPISLHALNRDVPTGVIGIERFLYEPNGDSYNVFFVRPSIQIDAQEVVMFNPRDEHRFTSHELDLLQYDGDHLDLRRGDRRRTQLPHAHWISILFD